MTMGCMIQTMITSRSGQLGSIMVPVETGLFVVADRTWFYSGSDIKSAEPIEVYHLAGYQGPHSGIEQ